MNISGRQYSKATQGLRQNQIIKDQNFKLVFIYPMLFDQSMSKYEKLLRDFISTSMLKEIFVSNSLNMITMASQITPPTDPSGNPIDTISTIHKINYSLDGGDYHSRFYNIPGSNELYKNQLQQKINQKTAIIKKLLINDPKISQYKPYIEIITMDNMIDVPVIVGTKKYDINSTVMSMILIVSVAEKNGLKLDNWPHVEKIFDIIKKMNVEDASTLFNAFDSTKGDKTTPNWWFNTFIAGGGNFLIKTYNKYAAGNIRSLPKLNSLIQPSVSVPIVKKEPLKPTSDELSHVNLDISMNILKSIQTNLDQAKLFFKFCLDTNLMKKQFGYNVGAGQTSIVIKSLNGNIREVFNNLINGFIKTLGIYGNPVTMSFTHILFPIGSDIDILKIREEIFNEDLISQITKCIEDFIMPAINSDLGSLSSEKANNVIQELQGLCKGDFSDSVAMIRKVSRNLQEVQITNPNYNQNQFIDYIQVLNDVSGDAATQCKRVEIALSRLTPQGSESLNKIIDIINSVLNKLSNEFEKNYNINYNNAAFFNLGINNMDSVRKLQNRLITATGYYLYFLFLYNLQIALCEYANTVDSNIETAKSDVLDLPNYTMVLPVEILLAISSALVAKNWKSYVQNPDGVDGKLVRASNDNYIKGIIKYFVKKLQVPNLIVIDSKKDDVYYQFMYMTNIQKTKLSTLETFIKLTTDQQLEFNTNHNTY